MNGQMPGEKPTPPESPAQTRRVALEIEKPVVTYVLMGVMALFFIAQTLCTQFLGFDLPAALLSKIRSEILAGQLWRLITPILLHGSILHVGLNLYALWILGRQLEGIYGHWRFLILFLVAGFWRERAFLRVLTQCFVGFFDRDFWAARGGVPAHPAKQTIFWPARPLNAWQPGVYLLVEYRDWHRAWLQY
jgi:Uncharacterized membrane protein (homolog of Drosophila rhomboid)